MDTLLALLLNVVYGFLFFLAFGVLFATMVVFALVFWDKVGRRLLRRPAPLDEPSARSR